MRIALRACELLTVGGRMVYSTCTFNPVEDEAVVQAVCLSHSGAACFWCRSKHLLAVGWGLSLMLCACRCYSAQGALCSCWT